MKADHVLHGVTLERFLMHFMSGSAQVRTWTNATGEMQSVFARSAGRQWWSAYAYRGGVRIIAIDMPAQYGGPRNGHGVMTRSLAGHGFLMIKQRLGISQ